MVDVDINICLSNIYSVTSLHNVVSNIISDIAEWRRNIREGVLYMHKKNEEPNELRKSCSCLCKLVLRINSNPKILDANEFPKYTNYNFLLRVEPKVHTISYNMIIYRNLICKSCFFQSFFFSTLNS